jgi:multisubunit Na+/H+ antiporter MnhB subunit
MGQILVSIVVLSVLYGWLYRPGYGVTQGAEVGVLIGLFAVCCSVLHDYAMLNIGLRLTVLSAVAYMVQWVVAGIVIGAIYRPAVAVAAGAIGV